MKEAVEQVVELFRAPTRIPNKIKDLEWIHHLNKWLAVLAQYKFACKHHAIAHIEELKQGRAAARRQFFRQTDRVGRQRW